MIQIVLASVKDSARLRLGDDNLALSGQVLELLGQAIDTDIEVALLVVRLHILLFLILSGRIENLHYEFHV